MRALASTYLPFRLALTKKWGVHTPVFFDLRTILYIKPTFVTRVSKPRVFANRPAGVDAACGHENELLERF